MQLLPLIAAALLPQGSGQLEADPLPGFFLRPTQAAAPLLDERVFVSEQETGLIRILSGGSTLATPFLDLSAAISIGGAEGLLNFCFDPAYASSGHFYVLYTNLAGDTVVSRFSVSAADPDLADPGSEKIVLTVPQPLPEHNGGGLAIGPDGMLYVGIGDGGGVNDPLCAGQDLTRLLGKVLRLDVSTLDSMGTYTIPSDNPFVGTPGARGEIWHAGFRQPWRLDFDTQTGDLWIGDVGEEDREELNLQPFGQGGINYGWQVLEGELCTKDFSVTFCSPALPACSDGGYTAAAYSYPHDFETFGCAVMGPILYRGFALGGLSGSAWFGDFCTNRLWSLTNAGTPAQSLTEWTPDIFGGFGFSNFTSVGKDGFGEPLLTTVSGTVFRVQPVGSQGIRPKLTSVFDQVSIGAGGSQQLLLDVGPSFAGQLYWILGSSTGTAPGLSVDGNLLPLELDAYTDLTLESANVGPFRDTLGTLDADGRAWAGIDVDAGTLSPALLGVTLHHAAVVIGSAPGASVIVDETTNATGLTFAP